MHRFFQIIGLLVSLLLIASGASAADQTSYTLGTGGEQGCYYAVGKALARLASQKHGLRLKAESTSGSVANINSVLNGQMTFGIAQSDRALQAISGKAEWAKSGPRNDLRAICGLYNETVMLVASGPSGIKECRDLRGKRVAIGAPGSGIRQNSMDALNSCHLTTKDLALAAPLNAEEASQKLQAGQLDGFFYTAGHPNQVIGNAAKGRVKVKLIGFPDVCRDKQFCYVKAWAPLDIYPGLLNKGYELPTCGVKAVLVTSAKTPEKVVYQIAELIGQNIDALKRMHPSLRRLELYKLVEDLHAPLHPGAIRYYKEKGIAK